MLVSHNSSAQNNTGFETQKFKLTVSAATFKVISSSLYERKGEAVLRELAANGLDAHIAADVANTPISITLPTELNPNLVIKDFGIGMSLDTVNNVVTNYFMSTKSSDNDQVGGFGLGFKSPFSISESYTLETTHKGITTSAVIFMDNGEPDYIITSSTAQGLPDGTIVTVPVDRDSIRKDIHAAAKHLFSYWSVPPIIDGVPASTNTITQYLQTPHFSTNSSHYYTSFSSVFAQVLVGPFVYNIPENLLQKARDYIKSNYSAELAFAVDTVWQNTSIILSTQVGDLELAPSRERIEDTDENYNFILSQITPLVIDASKEFLSTSETLLDLFADNFPADPSIGYTYPEVLSLRAKMLTVVGNEKLAESHLKIKTIEKKLTNKVPIFISDMISHTRFNTLSYYNIISKEGMTVNPGLKSLYDAAYDMKGLLETRSGGIRRDTASSYDMRYKLETTERVIILDGHTLTNQLKAKINYTLKEGDIALPNTTVTTNNYLELLDATHQATIEGHIKAGVFTGLPITFLYAADILPHLKTPPKATRKATTSSTRSVKNNNSIVGSLLTKYNEVPITVSEMYKEDRFKDTYVIIAKLNDKSDNNLLTGVSFLTLDKPIAILYLETRELSTKRFEQFKSDYSTIDMVGKYSYSDKADLIESLLGPDLPVIQKLAALATDIGYNNSEISDLFDYLPSIVSTTFNKLTFPTSLLSIVDYNRQLVTSVPIDDLFTKDSKEAVFWKYLRYRSPKSTINLIKLIDKPLIRRVLTTYYNSLK